MSDHRHPATAVRVYLMYHELELSGRPLCQNEPGYVRYIVTASDFEQQMRWLKSVGWSGLNVSEALAFPEQRGVVLTFDDGCETDLITAAPILKSLGFSAIFYITVGFLGRPGYMTRAQLRTLSDLGFEIGSHSMTHPYLSDLEEGQLREEIHGSKLALQEITGRVVQHFSCPGGRWDARVMEIAQESGYRSVATSRAVENSESSNPFRLGRVSVMRGTSLPVFQNLCQNHGLWKLRASDYLLTTTKRILGNSLYDKLRSHALGRTSSY